MRFYNKAAESTPYEGRNPTPYVASAENTTIVTVGSQLGPARTIPANRDGVLKEFRSTIAMNENVAVPITVMFMLRIVDLVPDNNNFYLKRFRLQYKGDFVYIESRPDIVIPEGYQVYGFGWSIGGNVTVKCETSIVIEEYDN